MFFKKYIYNSMSLHLGDEIFDVHTMPIQGDFNHLFVRQGTGLQGQSIFKTKLAFRYLYSMIVYCSFWGEGFLQFLAGFFNEKFWPIDWRWVGGVHN